MERGYMSHRITYVRVLLLYVIIQIFSISGLHATSSNSDVSFNIPEQTIQNLFTALRETGNFNQRFDVQWWWFTFPVYVDVNAVNVDIKDGNIIKLDMQVLARGDYNCLFFTIRLRESLDICCEGSITDSIDEKQGLKIIFKPYLVNINIDSDIPDILRGIFNIDGKAGDFAKRLTSQEFAFNFDISVLPEIYGDSTRAATYITSSEDALNVNITMPIFGKFQIEQPKEGSVINGTQVPIKLQIEDIVNVGYIQAFDVLDNGSENPIGQRSDADNNSQDKKCLDTIWKVQRMIMGNIPYG